MLQPFNVFVIAVGNNEVQNNPELTLRKAEYDAEHVLDLICERFPTAHAVQLLGKDASRDNICKALSHIANKTEKIPVEEYLVIFYFSGHGTLQHTSLNSGKRLSTAVLVTSDWMMDSTGPTGGLSIGAAGDEGTLLAMLAKIKGSKIAILDTCHGCAKAEKHPDHPKSQEVIQKGFCLKPGFQTNERPLCAKEELPENCSVISACDMDEFAREDDNGGMFTNAFLEAITRVDDMAFNYDSLIPKGHQVLTLTNVDSIELSIAIENANKLLYARQKGRKQNAHLITSSERIMIPRLPGSFSPMTHGQKGVDIGPTRPPVPSDIIPNPTISKIESVLESDNLKQPSVVVVYGPEASGKTTAVSSVCKRHCLTRDERDREVDLTNARSLAWFSLDDLTTNYIALSICYHMGVSAKQEYEILSSCADPSQGLQAIGRQLSIVINRMKGVVVFDNVEELALSSEDRDEVDLASNEKYRIAELIACLVNHCREGKIIVICDDPNKLSPSIREVIPPCVDSYVKMDRLSEESTQHMLGKLLDIENPKTQGPYFDMADIALARYLLQKGCGKVMKGSEGIWSELAKEIEVKGLIDYAVFLALFKGTNTESFLINTYGDNGAGASFEQLAKMGIVVREENCYHMHENIRRKISNKWGKQENRRDQVRTWHNNIASEYGREAKRSFHFCLIREAKRHYGLLGNHKEFSTLLLDPKIWSPLRNWGYRDCAKEWLLEVIQALDAADDGGDKRAWFVSALSLLELERHEMNFIHFEKLLPELTDHTKNRTAADQIKFDRVIGEAYLAQRDYDRSQYHFDSAFYRCVKQLQIVDHGVDMFHHRMPIMIEGFRVTMRLAEILVYRGYIDHALEMINSVRGGIRKCISACVDKTSSGRDDSATQLPTVFSDLIHQFAVSAALEAVAYLEINKHEQARLAASECIQLSLCCRTYKTGDVFGRAIGHIFCAFTPTNESVSFSAVGNRKWHVDKAMNLLNKRGLQEIWWWSKACAAYALALSDNGDFETALEKCTKGLNTLRQRLLPNRTSDTTQNEWHADVVRAKKLVGWSAPARGDDKYDVLRLSAMTREEFASQCDLNTFLLTDPWREAELLAVRVSIFRRYLETDNCNSDKRGERLNAAEFAAFVGFALARKRGHVGVMSRILADLSRIYMTVGGTSKLVRSLMSASVKIAGRIQNRDLVNERLLELSECLVTEDETKLDTADILNARAILYTIISRCAASCFRHEIAWRKTSELEALLAKRVQEDIIRYELDSKAFVNGLDIDNGYRREIPVNGTMRIRSSEGEKDALVMIIDSIRAYETIVSTIVDMHSGKSKVFNENISELTLCPGTPFESRITNPHVIQCEVLADDKMRVVLEASDYSQNRNLLDQIHKLTFRDL